MLPKTVRLGRLLQASVIGAAFALTNCAPIPSTPPQGEAPAIDRAWPPAALDDLRGVAESVSAHGLSPSADVLEEISRLEPDASTDAAAAAQLDLAADRLFASLARAFARGAAAPERADPQWLISLSNEPDIAALQSRLVAGEQPSHVLHSLLPQRPEYEVLVDELARVTQEPPDAEDDDGRSREERISNLRTSMERWRWLPRDLPSRRIEVRTPHFRVALIESDQITRSHAAIVGTRRTQTPSFVAQVRSVTLNPYWEPPSSILLNELLPQFRRDPDAAARGGYEALDSGGRAVPLADVDWSQRPFPYRVRQRPGPANALGRVRLDLPNPHAIYLHGTPSTALFNRSDRALSHGCIRVQDPVALAAAVLDQEDEQSLGEKIGTGATQVIPLTSPLPVYVLYMTAAVNENGDVVYADDIYNRDSALLALLDDPQATVAAQRSYSTESCPG